MVTASATSRAASTTGMARWPAHRIASVAAALVMVLMFPLFTGTEFFGFGPVPYFLAAFLVLAIALCFPLRAWMQRTDQVLLGLLGLFFMGANASFVFPELAHPEHFPDYGFSTLGVAAALVLAAAAVAAFIPALGHPARWGSWGVAALLVLAGVSVGATAAMYEEHAVPAAGAGSVLLTPDVTLEVTAQNAQFSPASLTLPAGKIVKIHVTNADSGTHNFRVDALGLASDLLAGKTTDLWIRTDKTGTYQFYCSIHSTQNADGTWTGMTGTLVVT